MTVKFFEAVEALHLNWGKFLVQTFSPEEWAYRSTVDGSPLLRGRGWYERNVLVMDLATGQGAIFKHGGVAQADLQKHMIWVCPLFEPFLEWLYQQDISDLSLLPAMVNLGDVSRAGSNSLRESTNGPATLKVGT